MPLFSKNNEFSILLLVSLAVLPCLIIIAIFVWMTAGALFSILSFLIGISLLISIAHIISNLIKKSNVDYLKSSLLVIERTHSQQLRTAAEELNLAQMRLVANEKLAFLGSLTAGIAHEIKNPLNFIINFSVLSLDIASNIEEELGTPVTQCSNIELETIATRIHTLKENIKYIIEQGKRSDSIVQHMLKHAMGETREFEPINIKELIEECCALIGSTFYPEDQDFKVDFEKNFDPEVQSWAMVPGDMSRVFINILNNAYDSLLTKYTSLTQAEKDAYIPKIWIQTRKLPSSLEITFTDNGIGISEEIKNKIFTPFFSTKPPGKGIGLGLSLSRTIIVEEHQGEISYDSVGKNTRFTIILPEKSR